MKKLLFVVVALGLSTGFAKTTKENKVRKPNQVNNIDQDAVKAACDILNYSLKTPSS